MDMISSNIIIIVLTCVVSYTAFNNAKLMDDWILSPFKALRDKQYYRYITYGFLHADGLHLLFNMITLYFFGRVMEVDVEVALRAHMEIEQAVPGELVQHVVEEADPGCDIGRAGAVEVDGDGDARFLGVALHGGAAHGASSG